MAYASEIDKLEQRYRENPKGRNFAPLADAYRKAGLLDNAIELCKSGLERHPDYVSAHIVYGRCLIDQKNDAAAAEVFRKVLMLDPENVLALRMLAEISQRGSRFDEAVDWLTRLLSADPMNGEVAEALSRMRSKVAQTAAKPAESVAQKLDPARKVPSPPSPMSPPLSPPSPPSPPPPHAPLRHGAATPPVPMPEFAVEHAAEEPVVRELKATPAPPPGDIEVFDGTLDVDAAAHGTAKAEGLEVQEEVQLKAQDLVVEGLAHTPFESVLGSLPEPEQDLPMVDLPLIMPEEVAETPPSHAAEQGAAAASPAVSAARPAPVPAPPVPPAPPAMPAAVGLSDDDGAVDAAALSRAEPVLTETMAELYLKQGHPDDALRVYQALLVQRPQDVRLRARVDALTPGGKREVGGRAGESLPAFLKRILAGRSQATGPSPVAVSPLEGAFAVAALEHEAQPEIEAPGEATRPADDTISLDQVFGEEGEATRGSLPAMESAPPRAASPPPSSSPPAAAEPTPATGGFSFDQFFNPPAAIVDASAGPGLTPAPRVSGPRPRPPAEDEGDLDQFQAWLKGLKS